MSTESSEILVNIDNNNNNIDDDRGIYVLSSFLLFSTNNIDNFNDIDDFNNIDNIDDDSIDNHGGIYFFKLFSFIYN